MTGLISDIKRFSTSDGTGIRTVVFFKGCTLSCEWCANPETQLHKPQILFYKNKCIGCGKCIDICPINAIEKNAFGLISGDKCVACGRCVDACLTNARELIGKEYSCGQLVELALKDEKFFSRSGGGVTLSGGELFCQIDFAVEFLKKLKNKNINTAIETAFFTSKEKIDRLLPFVDQIMCDVKHVDREKHREHTGVSNELILKNIRYVSEKYGGQIPITIRIPYIPGFNSSNDAMSEIFAFIKTLPIVDSVEILPYHRLGSLKYEAMGKNYALDGVLPVPKDSLSRYRELGKSFGLNVYIDAKQ